MSQENEPSNGKAIILSDKARPLANYPHARVAGGLIFVSGISSRRPDNTNLTVFLVNMDDYPAFNEVYNTYFEAQTGPARTTVTVKQLPSPKLLIEIKATALAP
ncbi:Endoribonuclease L-PSP/chorismate mutase-like protein [Gigaspora rosea]|uniref:Endoribonuclease L-PSP/chorismate mutase-like protein n=1 Tax=Gigaspora rosea TaxID=44941 RepID=A0A397UF39_9GLOM|nr:Endoribonuclease L-PSP/chorismate mutase-like protein [Gigaspora rosea]